MGTVAIGIMCKTPAAGLSKTRLSPPLRPEECALLSACFIRDISRTIGALATDGDVAGYAVYTPVGSESALLSLLPAGFRLLPQVDGDFGARLFNGAADLLRAGHDGVLLVNSDSPTLPASILRAAVNAVRRGDNVVLSPAADGGYTLIGLSRPHRRLFEDIVWSTSTVCQRTRQRAAEIDVPVVEVPPWYDVDDETSLRILEAELNGAAPAWLALKGADAPETRRFMREWQMSLADRVA
jgi:rSAM/selenodomain-associated transferase 1